jgi:hypothetical protein
MGNGSWQVLTEFVWSSALARAFCGTGAAGRSTFDNWIDFGGQTAGRS